MPILDFLDSTPTIEAVEQKVESLQEKIRMLKEYRNAHLLLVSKLPPEVLSLVFECLVFPREKYLDPYKPRLSITQVCRLWRNVAFDSPRIWSCIYDHTPKELAGQFLERAKSVPLSLCSGSRYPRPDTVQMLLERASQLKEIELSTCSSEWVRLITQSQTPFLERITLNFGGFVDCKVRFSSGVEHGTVPPFRHLSLRDCAFELDVPFFSHLRTLKIYYGYPSPLFPFSESLPADHVLLAIGNMEHLETLELVNAVYASDHIPETTCVVLPRLTSLCITSSKIEALSTLLRISCPSIEFADVTCSSQVGPDEVAPVASAFYSNIPTASGVPWQTAVRVDYSPPGCSSIMKIWPYPSVKCRKAPFEISVNGPTDFQTALALCSLLPTAGPLVLDFRSRDDFDDGTDDAAFKVFLRSLTHVEELHVGHINDILTILFDTPMHPFHFFSSTSAQMASFVYQRIGIAHLMGQLGLAPNPELVLHLLGKAATLASFEAQALMTNLVVPLFSLPSLWGINLTEVLGISDALRMVRTSQLVPPFSLPSLWGIHLSGGVECNTCLLSRLEPVFAARKAVNAGIKSFKIYGFVPSSEEMKLLWERTKMLQFVGDLYGD